MLSLGSIGEGLQSRKSAVPIALRIADYEASISKLTAAIVSHKADGYRIVGDVGCAEFEELVALREIARCRSCMPVGSAPFVGGLPVVSGTIRSAAETISGGASPVIVRGDGLVGGPLVRDYCRTSRPCPSG